MTEQRLWVTAYKADAREVLEATRNGRPVIFEFVGGVRAVERDKSAIDAVRRSDCKISFYDIPDPF